MTEKAEDGAIKVFKKNLEQLLMQPPIVGQVVLGWDPAFRTGCKLAVVDPTGKVLDTVVVYPTAPTTPADQKIRYHSDLSWQRNRFQRIGAGDRRAFKRDSGEGALCYHQ